MRGTMNGFNNFTPRAQRAVQLANREADRFNHAYVGTEHLLLGLVGLGEGVAEMESKKRQEQEAHAAAMARMQNVGMTDILGGLDG